MKYIYTIIFAAFLALNAQTAEQIKKQLQDAGVTPDQAKKMANERGISNEQIQLEAQSRDIDINKPEKSSKGPLNVTGARTRFIPVAKVVMWSRKR